MTLKEKFKEILTAFWINDWENECEQVADNCDMFYPNGKCRYCNLENDNHKMSCPIMKIQVNL